MELTINEPHHEKTCLCHMLTAKAQISLHSLISTFVVRCRDIILPNYLYFTKPKFQDSTSP